MTRLGKGIGALYEKGDATHIDELSFLIICQVGVYTGTVHIEVYLV